MHTAFDPGVSLLGIRPTNTLESTSAKWHSQGCLLFIATLVLTAKDCRQLKSHQKAKSRLVRCGFGTRCERVRLIAVCDGWFHVSTRPGHGTPRSLVKRCFWVCLWGGFWKRWAPELVDWVRQWPSLVWVGSLQSFVGLNRAKRRKEAELNLPDRMSWDIDLLLALAVLVLRSSSWTAGYSIAYRLSSHLTTCLPGSTARRRQILELLTSTMTWTHSHLIMTLFLDRQIRTDSWTHT